MFSFCFNDMSIGENVMLKFLTVIL
jgi:hypothetical protein